MTRSIEIKDSNQIKSIILTGCKNLNVLENSAALTTVGDNVFDA